MAQDENAPPEMDTASKLQIPASPLEQIQEKPSPN
jgi:hypothetical protein